MSSQALLDFKKELEAEIAKLLPELEGFRDFARTNISPSAIVTINSHIDILLRRKKFMDDTLAGLTGLDRDGYPDTPSLVLDPIQFSEVEDQVKTITAAFGRISERGEATNAAIVPGNPVEQ